MKIFFVAALAIFCVNGSFAQAPADLTVTLPTGKVVTFQSAGQKQKFLDRLAAAKQAQAAALANAAAAAMQGQVKEAHKEEMDQWSDNNKIVVRAEVSLLEDGGMMAHIKRYTAYKTVRQEGLNQVPKTDWMPLDLDQAESEYVFIDTVPANAVTYSSWRMEIYPCGIKNDGRLRYFSFTTDPEKGWKWANSTPSTVSR